MYLLIERISYPVTLEANEKILGLFNSFDEANKIVEQLRKIQSDENKLFEKMIEIEQSRLGLKYEYKVNRYDLFDRYKEEFIFLTVDNGIRIDWKIKSIDNSRLDNLKLYIKNYNYDEKEKICIK